MSRKEDNVKYRRRKTRWEVALAAACMLVLQSISSTFALGLERQSPQYDAFGNPICAMTDGGIHSDGPDRGHSQGLDCCTLGCSISAQLTGVPSDSAWVLALPLVGAAAFARPWQYRPASLSVSGAAHPRAPPLRA